MLYFLTNWIILYQNTKMNYILIIIFAILVWYIWLKVFRKLRILDRPGPDIIPARAPVPSIQWIPMILGIILCIWIFFNNYFFDNNLTGFIIWSILLGIIALIDNFIHISAKLRLLVQILVACISFFVSWVWFFEFTLPWWHSISIPLVIWLLLTIVWFIWFINAINWFDWINWLASGVSSIGFLTIFFLINLVVLKAHTYISPEKLHILTIVSNLSFLLFCFSFVYSFVEFKPLWVLRDIWVMFLGFSLAYLSLLWWAKIWTILVVLSLVIFDSIWVFINRIWVMKKSPLKWDYSHLHYRLLALKFSRTESRVFIWCWSLFLMVLMILQQTNRTNKAIIFIMMFLIFFWVNIYLFWIKKLPWEYKIIKDWKQIEKK